MNKELLAKLKALLRESFDAEMDSLEETTALKIIDVLSSVKNQAIILLESGELTKEDAQHVAAVYSNISAEMELIVNAAAGKAWQRFAAKLGETLAAFLAGALRA